MADVDVLSTLVLIFGGIWFTILLYNVLPLAWFGLLRLRAVAADEPDPLEDLVVDVPRPGELDRRPTIDALVPAYHDGNVVNHAIQSLRATEYPQNRLQVHVLVEPDDDDTRVALEDLRDEYAFTEVVVPDDYPGERNKPRALDYAFEVTDGDVVGVIDAEDIVGPNLPRVIAAGIAKDENDFVQGRLDMINEHDGWKNLVFRGEYGYWYRFLMPAYHVAGYPVPLGGTTNFFRRGVLETISKTRRERYDSPWPEGAEEWFAANGLEGFSPWDPRNVTEDFELGLSLWKEGYSLGYIDTSTREESPLSTMAWIKQRTRWQKGKIYTFLQWLRTPPEGVVTKLHFFAQAANPHVGPMNVVGVSFILGYLTLVEYDPPLVAHIVLVAGFCFVGSIAALWGLAYWRTTDSRTGLRRLVSALVVGATTPFYWLLQWASDIRALKQLTFRENHWEKTAHHGRNFRGDRIDAEDLPDQHPVQEEAGTTAD